MHLSLKELRKGLGIGGKTPQKSTSRQRRIMGEEDEISRRKGEKSNGMGPGEKQVSYKYI